MEKRKRRPPTHLIHVLLFDTENSGPERKKKKNRCAFRLSLRLLLFLLQLVDGSRLGEEDLILVLCK